MGYTPLFDSLTKGTLCGRWPDIGLWGVVLSMSDRYGVVDSTPTHIAAVSGLAIEEVVACMARFCEPDPYSRSQEAGGARLKLLDEHRQWGWQVVNHSKYREKARKQSFDSARTAAGLDAKRKRLSRDVPTRPDVPGAVPPSDVNGNGDKKKKKRAPSAHASNRCPESFEVTAALREWAEGQHPGVNWKLETAKFRDWEFKNPHSDWNAAWRRWMRKADEDAAKRRPQRRLDGLVV